MLLAVGLVLLGQTVDDLDKAKRLYFAAQPRESLAILDRLAADPKQTELLQVHRYQAYALFLLQLYDEARAMWLKVLELDPQFAPDPMQDSPEVVSFFGRIKLAPKPEPTPVLVTPAEDPFARKAVAPPTTRGCGVALCLLPLGVGQFANGRLVKGTLFALLQAGAIGANAGLYWAQSASERPNATRIALQRGTLVAAGLMFVVGVIDAFAFP